MQTRIIVTARKTAMPAIIVRVPAELKQNIVLVAISSDFYAEETHKRYAHECGDYKCYACAA